ncbi:MAG: glycoside hydrolase family 16 protein [Chitinophagaceae bacterium]|nr:glycoside hydrolase family 16 protein [Chitinophagaceae bacterium]
MIIKNKIRVKPKLFLLPAITALLFTMSGCKKDVTQTVTTFSNLVISDEFSIDGAPAAALWSYEIGRGPFNDGWGNNELEYYTSRPNNVKVVNGNLELTAIKESYLGSQYTSGRIITRGKFEQAYGRYEARIKLPAGQGIWPAFWLIGANHAIGNGPGVVWPQCGEIDIMENRGQEPTKIQGTVHGLGYSGANAITKTYSLPNDRFDNNFHVFGIEWGPEYINFYVDDKLYNQITPAKVTGQWVFDHPFYIILNLAVGGNYVGNPNAATSFPQTMFVDYVRVYQK